MSARHHKAAPKGNGHSQTDSPGPSGVLRPLWRDHKWAVVVAAAVAVYALSVWGLLTRENPPIAVHTYLNALYRGFKVFFMDEEVLTASGGLCWQLEVARWLAPVIAAFTAFQAVGALAREQMLLLRLKRLRGHVVVCGWGTEGEQIAADFAAHGDRVVVIEKEDAGDTQVELLPDGVLRLTGDATEEAVLLKARAPHARRVIVVCGNDGVNVEVAAKLHGLALRVAVPGAQPRQPCPETTLVCHVHLIDLRLRKLVEDSEIYRRKDDCFELRFFNIFERGAQALLRENPPVPLKQENTGPLHVLVVGFGDTGESIVALCAKQFAKSPGQPLRVTVVDRQAERLGELFRLSQSDLAKGCDLEFIELHTTAADFLHRDFLRGRGGLSGLAMVYVCLDSDAAGLNCGLNLHLRLRAYHAPVVICMKEATGLATLLEGSPAVTGGNEHLHAFCILRASCTRAAILKE